MTLTATGQRNAVSEGLALGLLLCGRRTLTHSKMDIDLALAGAWRDWDTRRRYPQVQTDLNKGLDGYHVITRATKSKSTFAFYWTHTGPTLEIIDRQHDWTTDPDDVTFAANLIDEDVPATAWQDLAKRFLHRLEHP